MKVTIDIPEELYRQVKAKSALEGRPVREVAEELFQGFVLGLQSTRRLEPEADRAVPGGEPVPEWFGALKTYARNVERHDMDSIHESIARGVAQDRDL